MINYLANRVASVFVQYGESADENKDIYAYALEAIIAFLVSSAVCILISFMFGRVLEGVVFMFGYAVLRRVAGGYHANTHKICILTFTSIVIASMILIELYSINCTHEIGQHCG